MLPSQSLSVDAPDATQRQKHALIGALLKPECSLSNPTAIQQMAKLRLVSVWQFSAVLPIATTRGGRPLWPARANAGGINLSALLAPSKRLTLWVVLQTSPGP